MTVVQLIGHDASNVSEANWESVFGGMVEGVFAGVANECQVIASAPPAMTVEIRTGTLVSGGVFGQVTAQHVLAIAASDPANPRIDRVVARRTNATDAFALAVLTGTPAPSPSAPALTRNGVYEISLAQVLVGAAVVLINTADITDERVTPSLCGFVSLKRVGGYEADEVKALVKPPSFAEVWTLPGWYNRALVTTVAPTANMLHYIPIYVPKTHTYTGVGFSIVGLDAAAGRLFRMGLYTWNDGAPDRLISDYGTVGVGSGDGPTGVKTIAISETLAPGYYFAAFVSDAITYTLRGPDSNRPIAPPVSAGFGSAAGGSNRETTLTTAARGADVAGGLVDPAPTPDSLDDADLSLLMFRAV